MRLKRLGSPAHNLLEKPPFGRLWRGMEIFCKSSIQNLLVDVLYTILELRHRVGHRAPIGVPNISLRGVQWIESSCEYHGTCTINSSSCAVGSPEYTCLVNGVIQRDGNEEHVFLLCPQESADSILRLAGADTTATENKITISREP
jgi:hypothetical protein